MNTKILSIDITCTMELTVYVTNDYNYIVTGAKVGSNIVPLDTEQKSN